MVLTKRQKEKKESKLDESHLNTDFDFATKDKRELKRDEKSIELTFHRSNSFEY